MHAQKGGVILKMKSYTFHVVPNCCRTPIPKLNVLMLHFHLSQDLSKFGLFSQNERNLLPKNRPDQQKRVAFHKSQKMPNHSTLMHICTPHTHSSATISNRSLQPDHRDHVRHISQPSGIFATFASEQKIGM